MSPAETYLSKQIEIAEAAGNETAASAWKSMKQMHHAKQWKQLTGLVREHVAHFREGAPVLHKDLDLEVLYENFIARFADSANPKDVAVILCMISEDIFEKRGEQAAWDFVDKYRQPCKKDAVAAVRLQVGEIELRLKARRNNVLVHGDEIKRRLPEIQEELEKLHGVTEAHAPFFKTSAAFLRETKNYAAYYREALRYLGCEDLGSLTEATKTEYAILVSFAALLGDDVYNIGELLAHPVMQYLEVGEYSWLKDLIVAFNAGDIPKFQALKTSWGKWPDLAENEVFITNKVRLLSIMELALSRAKSNRSLSLQDIAQKAQVKEKEAEFLVMRAVSKNLIIANINEVDKLVTISWIAPRVLTRIQIRSLMKQINAWEKDVEVARVVLEKEADPIFVHQ